MRLTTIFIGVVIGSLLYQYFGAQDYRLAFERSYFMGLALFFVWIDDKMFNARCPQASEEAND